MSSAGSFGGNPGSSTRPYLIRALHDWCTDNGFTPYIAVHVDRHVQVPMEYVKANEIVLNVGFEATSGLTLGNETIEFKARFGGTAREIVVPIDHVIAIYARENGQGMAFPVPAPGSAPDDGATAVPIDGSSSKHGSEGVTLGAGSTGDGTEGLHLVPQGTESAEPPADSTTEPPPEGGSPRPPSGTPSGGARPALKRIK